MDFAFIYNVFDKDNESHYYFCTIKQLRKILKALFTFASPCYWFIQDGAVHFLLQMRYAAFFLGDFPKEFKPFFQGHNLFVCICVISLRTHSWEAVQWFCVDFNEIVFMIQQGNNWWYARLLTNYDLHFVCKFCLTSKLFFNLFGRKSRSKLQEVDYPAHS